VKIEPVLKKSENFSFFSNDRFSLVFLEGRGRRESSDLQRNEILFLFLRLP